MKFTGKLKEPIIDYLTGRLTILFEPREDFRQTYEELKDCDKLSFEIKKYKARRSLNANSYFHVLNGKIADKLGISKTRCKNLLICSYGQPDINDNGDPFKIEANISVGKMLEQEIIHCKPCGYREEDGIELNSFYVYRGSHTYNTEEMSILIDGAIQEAKDIGIPDAEIATPDEKRLLKERYGVEL